MPAPATCGDRRLLRLSPDDNICAVTTTLAPGDTVTFEGRAITVADRIPTGHKMALVSIPAGGKIVKYGASIGSAKRDIRPGEYVHTHNVKSDYLPTFTLDGANPYLPH